MNNNQWKIAILSVLAGLHAATACRGARILSEFQKNNKKAFPKAIRKENCLIKRSRWNLRFFWDSLIKVVNFWPKYTKKVFFNEKFYKLFWFCTKFTKIEEICKIKNTFKNYSRIVHIRSKLA